MNSVEINPYISTVIENYNVLSIATIYVVDISLIFYIKYYNSHSNYLRQSGCFL